MFPSYPERVKQNMDVLPATAVLLIDPNAADRDYWAHRLLMSSSDYRIWQAEDMQSGLDLYRSQKIDCVVLEQTLPDMSGFKLLVNLIPRPRHPDVAVVMLTRLDHPSLAALAFNQGAQAYLVKSRCSGDKLHMAIQKAIAAVGPPNKEHRQSDR